MPKLKLTLVLMGTVMRTSHMAWQKGSESHTFPSMKR